MTGSGSLGALSAGPCAPCMPGTPPSNEPDDLGRHHSGAVHAGGHGHHHNNHKRQHHTVSPSPSRAESAFYFSRVLTKLRI